MKIEKYQSILHELKQIDILARSSVSNDERINLPSVTKHLDNITEYLREEVN